MAGQGDVQPSLPTMLWRAVRRRCPRCGAQGAFFTGWFTRADRCKGCGYRWERHEGFVLGPITINTVITFGLVGIVLVGGLLATLPEIDPWPVVIPCVAIAVVVPIVIYPITWTIWAALDLRWSPLSAEEVADASAHATDAKPSDDR
jgi:uncharacterized protein (DUF983 family)